ncbi:MAG: aminotransferase class I/II-fold pyridoxal phosphate-dependent enzyme [Acidimicrobiales bacterium]|jgi:dTDP-4-amino-4,6-dideoxygalactose transaminase
MKSDLGQFAVLGGAPEFATELHVGQLYFPKWEQYETAMRGIIDRRYYTNHGPLIRELEARLEEFFQVGNVVTVTNATIGLYLVCLALGLEGKVIMPSFTFVATAQAALLAGLDAVFCEVDPHSHQMTPATAEKALEERVSAVCPVNLWGGSADVPALDDWARSHNLDLFFDSAHGFGVERMEGKLGRFGRAEVFSFHATKVMTATEGGCVCTDDDDLAERIRNMRSNYGIRRSMPVSLTVNARMSEAQAAIALASLEGIDGRIANNRMIFETYRSALDSVPGVRLVQPSNVTRSNHQCVVIEITEDLFGLPRDVLWSVLRAEGVRARRYFKPGVHRSIPFNTLYPKYLEVLPITDALCDTVLQLPIGALVTTEDAERIGGLIRDVHAYADGLLACG